MPVLFAATAPPNPAKGKRSWITCGLVPEADVS
jgi:hypothetical protein